MKNLRKKLFLLAFLILLTPQLGNVAAEGDIAKVTTDAFFTKMDAFMMVITGDQSAKLYEIESVALPLAEELVVHAVQGDGWYATIFADENQEIYKVVGQVPLSSEQFSMYSAVAFALSHYEADSARFFLLTPEGQRAIAVNFHINGYERFLTFAEESSSTHMKFTFQYGVKKTFQFLDVGTYKVGEGKLYPGEYYATTSMDDSSFKVYRDRKLVRSLWLNKNVDSDTFMLFEGDVVEVRLAKAFLVPTK